MAWEDLCIVDDLEAVNVSPGSEASQPIQTYMNALIVRILHWVHSEGWRLASRVVPADQQCAAPFNPGIPGSTCGSACRG